MQMGATVMRRRTWVVNGALVAAVAAVGVAAAATFATPAASESSDRTATVAKGEVTASVSASGNLSAATTVNVDFSGSGGTVTDIYVVEGDKVKRGEALAKVDDTTQRQQLRTAKAGLASAEAQLASTTAGQTSAEKARSNASVRSAQASVTSAQDQLAQARRSSTLDKSQQNAAVAAAQANYDATMNDPAATEVAKQAADSELRQAKSTRDSVLLKDSQAIENARNQVAAAKVQVSSAKASAAVDSQGPTSGAVASANAQVETAQVQVDAAQQALDETTLRAPAPGTVTSVNGAVGQSSTSAGASDATGSTSTAGGGFVVITDMTALEVDTMVSEADATQVKVGQPATITFPATDASESGEVTTIDVQETVTNNVVEYGVTVSLVEGTKGLKLGQTADVSIETGSASNVLYVPTSAITTAGGISTVTVRTDGVDTPTVVQTGLEGNSRTEIVSGLAEGDVVVIPTAANSGTGFTFPGGGSPLGGGFPRGGPA